jgi:HlyD family secretion protein
VGIVGVLYGAKVALLPKADAKTSTVNRWKTEKLMRGDVTLSITTIGTLNPTQLVWVGSQVSGKVQQVLKKPNDPVKKDELMGLLDTELLESDRRTAEVHLSQSQGALSLLRVERANLVLRDARLKQSLASKQIAVERAKATLELASKNRKRYEDLIVVSGTSQTEVDMRVLEEGNCERDMRMTAIELELLKLDQQQVESDYKQIAVREELAQADIDQSRAALERAKTNLNYARIVSPIDGVVMDRAIELGQTLAATFQTPNMFQIAADLSSLRIDAQVDEADVGKIKAGQEVTFEVDAWRGETFKGTVTLVRLLAKNTANLVTYPVQVEASNPADPDHPHGKLLPGMTASLKFVVAKRPGVLLLPGTALRFVPPPDVAPKVTDTGETKTEKQPGTRGTVFVTDKLGVLQRRVIRVGDSDGEKFELLTGDLKEGDEVVVGANEGAAKAFFEMH